MHYNLLNFQIRREYISTSEQYNRLNIESLLTTDNEATLALLKTTDKDIHDAVMAARESEQVYILKLMMSLHAKWRQIFSHFWSNDVF